jgi:hypothetical protein
VKLLLSGVDTERVIHGRPEGGEMGLTCLLLGLLPASPPAAEAEDYLIIFSADSIPYRATRTHTFVAVVSVERGRDCPPRVVCLRSLSWLPATGKVRGLAMRAEAGRNVPLDETLHTYLAAGRCVCMWGPYRIRPELAETFHARVATVESWFQYRAACRLSPRHVCDCARSVEEMVEARRRYIGVFGYGAAAASVIVQKLSPWMIEPEQCHPWVGTLIGLDGYPLVRRPFGDYTSWRDQLRSSIWGR